MGQCLRGARAGTGINNEETEVILGALGLVLFKKGLLRFILLLFNYV